MDDQAAPKINRVTLLIQMLPILLSLLFLVFNSNLLLAEKRENPLRVTIKEYFLAENKISGDRAIAGLSDLDTARRFYHERNYQPAWFGKSGRLTPAKQLIKVLMATVDEGLEPQAYHLARIRSLQKDITIKHRSIKPYHLPSALEQELLLTDAFLTCAGHFLYGRVDPKSIDPQWSNSPKQNDLLHVLQRAIETGQVAENLEYFLPQHIEYFQLKMALLRYRSLSAIGGWPRIGGPDAIGLKEGQRNNTIPALRRRLQMTGDLPSGLLVDDRLLFDENITEAVSRFQFRHGLKIDGKVGGETLVALNIPIEDKINRIKINLDRLRWMSRDLGNPRIWVNIPEFKLYLKENSQTVLESRVIVGRPDRQTPIFSSTMSILIINPNWYIPPGIFINDILPRVRKDPGYLDRRQMTLYRIWEKDTEITLDANEVNWDQYDEHKFPFVVRQDPGPFNELGVMKFMFPNQFDIYLHDTPNKKLYHLTSRENSSGCIRVERYQDLADYLLKENPEWNRDRIAKTIPTRDPIRIDLKRTIPIHLVYHTAWVDTRNLVHFAADIYHRDTPLKKVLGISE